MSTQLTSPEIATIDRLSAPVVLPGPTAAEMYDRRQAAILALGRRAIVSPDATLLTQDAVQMLVGVLDADFGAAADLSADGNSLTMRLQGGTVKRNSDELPQRYEMGDQNSLAGHALSTARALLVVDLASDTRFADNFLLSKKARSAIACPLALLNQSYGALIVFRTRSEPFTEQDVQFVEAISHMVATTVARERAERALEDGNALADSLWTGSPAAMLIASPTGRVERANPACSLLSGFEAGELDSRTLRELLFTPEDFAQIDPYFDRALKGREPLRFDATLLTKSGERKHVEWSFSGVKNRLGKVTSVVASGIDITAEHDLRNKVPKPTALPDPFGTPTNLPEFQQSDSKAKPTEAGVPTRRERRGRPRRAYPYIQWIAPMHEGRLPPRSEFREVRCRDISAGGFSFIVPRPPSSDSFVVAFGSGAALTHLVAQAIHCNRVVREGLTMYIVGCHYTSRVSY